MYRTFNKVLEVNIRELRQGSAYLKNKNIHIERKTTLHYLHTFSGKIELQKNVPSSQKSYVIAIQ